MRCESCGAPGAGNFCGECGAPMPAPQSPAPVAAVAKSAAAPAASPPPSSRSRGRLVSVVAAAFLLGVALPAAFIAGAGIKNPTAAGTVTPPSTTTVTATATTTVTATATPTVKVTTAVTASAEPTEAESEAPSAAQSSRPAQPRGALLVQAGPEGGFGQTFPDGGCAVWRSGFINQSDTAVDQITMAPPGGEYTGEWNGHGSPTRPASKPVPAVLNVYIAPGQSAAFEYKTCTWTASPGPKFEYGAFAPDYLTFRWETGEAGRACFKC